MQPQNTKYSAFSNVLASLSRPFQLMTSYAPRNKILRGRRHFPRRAVVRTDLSILAQYVHVFKNIPQNGVFP